MLGDQLDMAELLKISDDPLAITEVVKECLNYNAPARPLFGDIVKKLTEKEKDLLANPEKDAWNTLEIVEAEEIKNTIYGIDVEEYDKQENQD
jgi:hypothetical protein